MQNISPPECTTFMQAGDGGLGRNTKFLVNKHFEHWLQDDVHLDKWKNGSFTASEKRILITQFVGEAWEEMFLSGKYHPTSYFEKTGTLLTLDGSKDAKIKMDGIPSFKMPPIPHNFEHLQLVAQLDEGLFQAEVIAPAMEPSFEDVAVYESSRGKTMKIYLLRKPRKYMLMQRRSLCCNCNFEIWCS